MDLEALLAAIVDIIGSKLIVFLFSAVIIVMALKKMLQKSNKQKLLLADARFNGACFFHKTIRSPMAVSPEGLIGIVLDSASQPIVVSIKDITEFRMMSDGCVIARGDKNDPDGIFSKDATATMGQSIQVKTKGINILFSDKDGLVYNVPLFVSTLRRRIVPSEFLQNEIKQLLSVLEEIEKNLL